MQIKLYTIFFFKIALANKLNLLYTLVLPAVLLSLQLYSQPSNDEVVSATIIYSWLAYMIINHALTHTFAVSILREQGYLKQYHTIVKSVYIFLISEALVGLFNLMVSTLLLLILMSFLTQISIIQLVVLSFRTILLTYPALVLLFSFFLRFKVNRQTISTIQNAAMMVLIVALIITQAFLTNELNFILNIINPLTLIMSTFYSLQQINLSDLVIRVVPILIIYGGIGIMSLKNIEILPSEGH